MTEHQQAFEVIEKLVGQKNSISIPRILIQATGSIKTALFLAEVLYWTGKGEGAEGWFFKTYEQWEEEICLSKHEVSKAAEWLRAKGVIETEVRRSKGGAPTVHYRASISAFRKWIVENFNYGKLKKSTMDSEKNSLSYKETSPTTSPTAESQEQNTDLPSPEIGEAPFEDFARINQARAEAAKRPIPPKSPTEPKTANGFQRTPPPKSKFPPRKPGYSAGQAKPVQVTALVVANGYDPTPGFEWFCQVYPHVPNRDQAQEAWGGMVTDQETEDLIRAALAQPGPWFLSQNWADGIFHGAGNWLLQRLWLGKPAPVRSKAERDGFAEDVARHKAFVKRGLA